LCRLAIVLDVWILVQMVRKRARKFGNLGMVMTATSEQGIAYQMQIEAESRRYLHQFPGAQAATIQTALEPLLESPPRPVGHWKLIDFTNQVYALVG
jgi:hypothetical protein